jgi:hypothetical protein
MKSPVINQLNTYKLKLALKLIREVVEDTPTSRIFKHGRCQLKDTIDKLVNVLFFDSKSD